MAKILLGDDGAEQSRVHDLLKDLGTIERPQGKILSEGELTSRIKGTDALAVMYAKVTEKTLRASDVLKIVAKVGAGYDNIDVKVATDMGIYVTNAAQANVEGLIEHTLAMMIILSKKMLLGDKALREGNWGFRQQVAGTLEDIQSKTIGIIGLGDIGSKISQRAAAFNLKVLAYDPYVSEEIAMGFGAELVDLKTLLETSDFVSINCPLNEKTFHLIGSKELRMMKKSAFLINTARGGIVDETALCEALEKKWIAGAGLDVFSQEPPDFNSPLFKMDNCILTPHIAGSTRNRYASCGRIAAEDIRKVLRGETPRLVNLVNPQVIKNLRF